MDWLLPFSLGWLCCAIVSDVTNTLVERWKAKREAQRALASSGGPEEPPLPVSGG